MSRRHMPAPSRETLGYLASPVLRSENLSASEWHRRQRRFWCSICFVLGLALGLML